MAIRIAAESEWVTRKELVDRELRAVGWRVMPYADKPLTAVERCAVEEYPTRNGPADYALARLRDGRRAPDTDQASDGCHHGSRATSRVGTKW